MVSLPSASPPPQSYEEASEAYVQSLVRGAQWYTSLGRQVVPLRIGEKIPAGGDGWNLPGNELIARDPATAALIWDGRYRGCGIGMYCSYESRTLILDIDVKNGAQGHKSLMEHQSRHGALPPTMKNHSPSGGFHLVFETPEEWMPAVSTPSRGSVNGMDILFSRRQAVMAPTRLTDGNAYGLDYMDPVNRIPHAIAVLMPHEVDRILYGKDLPADAERTTDWSRAHSGAFDGDTAERNQMADKLIDALSQYPSDSFGKAIVEADCRKMRETPAGARYNRLKELAMHLVLAAVNDGAVIKMDDAMNELMAAYAESQAGEFSDLEASNAEDTMRWAITRPTVVRSLLELDALRGWAGAMTMPASVAKDAQDAISEVKTRAYRDRLLRRD